jgi:molecular chaperone HtpG
MTHGLRRIPFQVDMAGVIEIMGKSLYSTPATPIRELVQNAHDGIRRRRMVELDYSGSIRVRRDPVAATLTFEDDGVGLDEAEAERYLGTVGVSLTGAVKRTAGEGGGLIGQFGIGLLSAFLIARSIRVESWRGEGSAPVVWIAGDGAEIRIGRGERSRRGTCVTLELREDAQRWAEDGAHLEEALRHYAEYLEVPIHVGEEQRRVNLARAAWFDATPDEAEVRAELEQRFGETPLAVCSLRIEQPVRIQGALYVTAQRTPGFTSESTVHATLRRMLISTSVRDLVPRWAGFLRGVVELSDCNPTASREDFVRDAAFGRTKEQLERLVFEWLENMARERPAEWRAMLEWHRYTLTGSALDVPRLRALLGRTLEWRTSHGRRGFDAILAASEADPLLAEEVDHVVWFNADRAQEAWIDRVFARSTAPCVHAVESFELTLLGQLARDAAGPKRSIELRPAKLSSKGFGESVLGVREHTELEGPWADFLRSDGLRVFTGRLDGAAPCLAFVDERAQLVRAFEGIRELRRVPTGFQALIDRELALVEGRGNELLLDLAHPLVARALAGSTAHPLASVLRVQALAALESAGSQLGAEAKRQRESDLSWIADALR